nr:hypothetical protein [Candidatus Fukatsuia symbiotica]
MIQQRGDVNCLNVAMQLCLLCFSGQEVTA